MKGYSNFTVTTTSNLILTETNGKLVPKRYLFSLNPDNSIYACAAGANREDLGDDFYHGFEHCLMCFNTRCKPELFNMAMHWALSITDIIDFFSWVHTWQCDLPHAGGEGGMYKPQMRGTSRKQCWFRANDRSWGGYPGLKLMSHWSGQDNFWECWTACHEARFCDCSI